MSFKFRPTNPEAPTPTPPPWGSHTPGHCVPCPNPPGPETPDSQGQRLYLESTDMIQTSVFQTCPPFLAHSSHRNHSKGSGHVFLLLPLPLDRPSGQCSPACP